MELGLPVLWLWGWYRIQQNGQKFSNINFPIFVGIFSVIAAILQFYDNSLFVMAVKWYLYNNTRCLLCQCIAILPVVMFYLFGSKKNSYNAISIAYPKSVY